MHGNAVAGIRAGLLSADVQLHGAVDCSDRVGDFRRGGRAPDRVGTSAAWHCNYGSVFEPSRFQIFQQSFPAAFTTKSTFAISAESASGVKKIGAIDPNHSDLDLCPG